jgi:hypothetical protein
MSRSSVAVIHLTGQATACSVQLKLLVVTVTLRRILAPTVDDIDDLPLTLRSPRSSHLHWTDKLGWQTDGVPLTSWECVLTHRLSVVLMHDVR